MQAHEEASKLVQQRELQLARQWQAQRTATAAQKQYAASVLAVGVGAADDGASGAAASAELRALLEQRRARMMEDVEQQAARILAASGGGQADGERPAPVLRVRVSGVVPLALCQQGRQHQQQQQGLGDAALRLWRVSDEEDGLREGDVVRITGLKATRNVDLGAGRMLQLDMTKMTRCAYVCRFVFACAVVRVGWVCM